MEKDRLEGVRNPQTRRCTDQIGPISLFPSFGAFLPLVSAEYRYDQLPITSIVYVACALAMYLCRMSLIYAIIARKTVVLAEYTRASGNFTTVTRVVLNTIGGPDTLMSYGKPFSL